MEFPGMDGILATFRDFYPDFPPEFRKLGGIAPEFLEIIFSQNFSFFRIFRIF
jgi:hypothetical protein